MPDTPTPPGSAEFTALIETTQRAVQGFVRGMLGGDSERARDVAQDVFVDAWRAASRGTAPFDVVWDVGSIRRWLFHVAYRKAVSARRHEDTLRMESLDMLPAAQLVRFCDPRAFEDTIAEGEALHAALAELGSLDAACLLLNVVQGFPAIEIAEMLDCTPAAAKKRLTHAKQSLRAAYFAQHSSPREEAPS